MKIYDNIADIPFTERGIISIGTFDGLHRGHRKIIDRLIEAGSETGRATFVITFSNHPFEVLRPHELPDQIACLDYKINFFRKKGINHLVLIKFTEDFAARSHQDFFADLSAKYGDIRMILGDDFRFGRDNLGDIQYLKDMSRHSAFSLEIINRSSVSDGMVSSSRIRELIRAGNLELAADYLERHYFMEGVIERGERLGRQIGFPTVNISNNVQVRPKNGVYKSRVEIDDNLYPSMTFVGEKSLSGLSHPVIETHIFNFNREIYQKKIRVHFIRRIRDEMKFRTLDDLKAQLEKDKVIAQG
ncbi:MAG: bifunctional riboflavin kinase/FAD synthetase [Spirochaetota bacterium]|nr:bifunctional riboflavin kinase/FAD synthetase [Spirochaetota bacterium]